MSSDDTRAAADVEQAFDRGAGIYDVRWARYNLATHRATVTRLALRGDERVLDVGCGTGELERHLVCKWPGVRIVGADLCAEMLGQATTKFAPQLAVRYLRANGVRLPFRSGAFDVVVSCNAFHFIPDPQAALSEMARVLGPGGLLVLTDWCADYLTCRLLDSWLVLTGRAAHAGSVRSGRCHDLLVDAGFIEESLATYRVGWFWGMLTAVARRP